MIIWKWHLGSIHTWGGGGFREEATLEAPPCLDLALFSNGCLLICHTCEILVLCGWVLIASLIFKCFSKQHFTMGTFFMLIVESARINGWFSAMQFITMTVSVKFMLHLFQRLYQSAETVSLPCSWFKWWIWNAISKWCLKFVKLFFFPWKIVTIIIVFLGFTMRLLSEFEGGQS